MHPLYSVLVRPHMTYCAQFQFLSYKRNMGIMKRVQWRTTRTINSLKHLSDEQGLRNLGLPSLKKTRFRGISLMSLNS